MTPPPAAVGDHDPAAVLARFLAAIEAGDLDAVRGAYHPDAVIWHSHDRSEESVEHNLRTLAWITTHLPGLRYTNVRRHGFSGGVVQQHDTVVAVPGSATLTMTACLVVRIDDDGLITRVDEYLDSAAVAELTAMATSNLRTDPLGAAAPEGAATTETASVRDGPPA